MKLKQHSSATKDDPAPAAAIIQRGLNDTLFHGSELVSSIHCRKMYLREIFDKSLDNQLMLAGTILYILIYYC